MSRSLISKIGVLAAALALALAALAGCNNAAASAASSEQQANRAYMSQVNEIMVELGGGLESFGDAVSRNDIVNMRTQADNAYRSLDKLKDLEVPEGLEDIQKKYQEGADKLREALDKYIELYSEMSSASFDNSTYDSRIAEIQKVYDEGISALEEGDKTAAEKS